jgi:hypothetical protein
LNDVVLAICAGALRRQYARDKTALAKAMIGAVPVSLRARRHHAGELCLDDAGGARHQHRQPASHGAIVAASTRAKMLTGSMKARYPPTCPRSAFPG